MSERVRIHLDGRVLEVEAGTSLLAALWNAGVRATRASVTGAGRGPLCGMGTCFECRVTVDGEPHRRACSETVRAGMDVRTGATQPASVPLRDGDRREAAVDALEGEVVVVGAGPAGIAATVHAAEAGAHPLLIDEAPRAGGQIWRHRADAPAAARPWLRRLARSGATMLAGATVVDAPSAGTLLVERDGQPTLVRYRRLVLATGARELLLPFPGWTLPGVVGAGGAQALLKAGARFDGRRVVVAGSGPLLLAVAASLRRAGARMVGVVEQAPLARLAAFGLRLGPRRLAEGLALGAGLLGVPYRTGAWVREAQGGAGVERVRVSDGRREWSWACDVLACGFGLVPNLELPRLLGCRAAADGLALGADQQTSVAGVYAAGELGGVAGVDHALASGAVAGTAAGGRPVPAALTARRAREARFGARLDAAFALRAEVLELAAPQTIVCRCEDVPLGRIDEALAADSTSPGAAVLPAMTKALKLHTRTGMGACQGRVCGAALARLRGLAVDEVRPPLSPATLGTLAVPTGTEDEP